MSVELDSRLASALAVQMNREMVAALTYKQMRNDLRLSAWCGFSDFFAGQETEEIGHSQDFADFLAERNVRPEYTNIQPHPVLYSPENPLYYFETALALERLFWVYMEELYQLSEDLDDPDTCRMLYIKIKTQHESVDEFVALVTKVKRAGMNIAAMQALDHDMQTK